MAEKVRKVGTNINPELLAELIIWVHSGGSKEKYLKTVSRARVSDGRKTYDLGDYTLEVQTSCYDEPGQRHVEAYHNRNDVVTLSRSNKKMLEMISRREWEYTTDGFDPQTEDYRDLGLFNSDPLCEKIEKELEAVRSKGEHAYRRNFPSLAA